MALLMMQPPVCDGFTLPVVSNLDDFDNNNMQLCALQ